MKGEELKGQEKVSWHRGSLDLSHQMQLAYQAQQAGTLDDYCEQLQKRFRTIKPIVVESVKETNLSFTQGIYQEYASFDLTLLDQFFKDEAKFHKDSYQALLTMYGGELKNPTQKYKVTDPRKRELIEQVYRRLEEVIATQEIIVTPFGNGIEEVVLEQFLKQQAERPYYQYQRLVPILGPRLDRNIDQLTGIELFYYQFLKRKLIQLNHQFLVEKHYHRGSKNAKVKEKNVVPKLENNPVTFFEIAPFKDYDRELIEVVLELEQELNPDSYQQLLNVWGNRFEKRLDRDDLPEAERKKIERIYKRLDDILTTMLYKKRSLRELFPELSYEELRKAFQNASCTVLPEIMRNLETLYTDPPESILTWKELYHYDLATTAVHNDLYQTTREKTVDVRNYLFIVEEETAVALIDLLRQYKQAAYDWGLFLNQEHGLSISAEKDLKTKTALYRVRCHLKKVLSIRNRHVESLPLTAEESIYLKLRFEKEVVLKNKLVDIAYYQLLTPVWDQLLQDKEKLTDIQLYAYYRLLPVMRKWLKEWKKLEKKKISFSTLLPTDAIEFLSFCSFLSLEEKQWMEQLIVHPEEGIQCMNQQQLQHSKQLLFAFQEMMAAKKAKEK